MYTQVPGQPSARLPARVRCWVRQVDVLGLVATGFTHRDSRAGEPDLHTHFAVATQDTDRARQVAQHLGMTS
jgi:hypothetical protein